VPRTLQLQLSGDVIARKSSARPSQFSSIRLPRSSCAFGRIVALLSLQSWFEKKPSRSASIPPTATCGGR
jgi:hypothetical protein